MSDQRGEARCVCPASEPCDCGIGPIVAIEAAAVIRDADKDATIAALREGRETTRDMRVTFMLRDTHVTYVSLVHENETVPHRRRVVTIELTPEQMKAIAPRSVGFSNGKDVFEEITECWIENDPPKEE